MVAPRSMSPVLKRIGDVRYHQSISIQEPLSFAYMFYKKGLECDYTHFRMSIHVHQVCIGGSL